MTTLATSLDRAAHPLRAGLVALYAAIALLGSGGLHAIAPGCQSGCCASADAPEHSPRGCSHHHHHHAPPKTSDRDNPSPADLPTGCPEGCLICEFAATQALPVAIVVATPILEEVGEPSRPANHVAAGVVASRFWIRGPPAVG